MNVTGGLAAAAVFAGAAIGFASPARADDFSGTFVPNGPGLQSTWVVTSCGPDCARIADRTGWTVDAHPWDGLWRFVVDLPDGDEVQQRRRGAGDGHLQGRREPARGHHADHESLPGVSMGTRTGLLESGHLHVDQNLSRGQKPTRTPIPTPPQSSSGFGHETST
jgi:hypothetical protein